MRRSVAEKRPPGDESGDEAADSAVCLLDPLEARDAAETLDDVARVGEERGNAELAIS